MTKDKDKDKDDSELSSFRIGDLRRPEVKNYNNASAVEDQVEVQDSVGFPAVEQRLENGSIESLAEELRPSYEALEELSLDGDIKQKAAAKRAMAAYERTADLFEYLFETKSAMLSPDE